jgi:hypothetical protein
VAVLPYRLVLSPRLAVPRWLRAATLIGGIAFGLLCCAIFLIAFGVPAGDLANQFILYVFGNSDLTRPRLALGGTMPAHPLLEHRR